MQTYSTWSSYSVGGACLRLLSLALFFGPQAPLAPDEKGSELVKHDCPEPSSAEKQAMRVLTVIYHFVRWVS